MSTLELAVESVTSKPRTESKGLIVSKGNSERYSQKAQSILDRKSQQFWVEWGYNNMSIVERNAKTSLIIIHMKT